MPESMTQKAFIHRTIFFLLLLFCFSSQLLWAAENENEERRVKRETAAAKETAQEAKKAKTKRLFEKTGQIAFEEILKRPDDVELNFQYAQQQVQKEDLLGAAGTLERILITNPDLHEVRLFYAVVLFRLDNLIDAGNELDKLSKLELPAGLREQAGIYQSEIRKRKRKTHLAVTQSNGFEFDSNRNASPSSKRVLFADAPINTSEFTRRRKDNSFLNITTVDVAQDLGMQAGHQLIGSFTYFRQDQTHVRSLDLSSFQYDLGAVLKNKIADFTPSFSAGNIFLSSENYLRTQAGNFELTRDLTPKLNWTTAFRFEHQDYLPIFENQTARNRTGWEETLTNGASYALPWDMRAGAGVLYSHKNARQGFEAYNRLMPRFFHSWLLGHGQFLVNSLDVGFDRYRQMDGSVATVHRHDATLRYRVTYGAPLAALLIGRILPRPLKDITATCTYEYFRSLSNTTNYTYTNNKVQFMLTKRLEF